MVRLLVLEESHDWTVSGVCTCHVTLVRGCWADLKWMEGDIAIVGIAGTWTGLFAKLRR